MYEPPLYTEDNEGELDLFEEYVRPCYQPSDPESNREVQNYLKYYAEKALREGAEGNRLDPSFDSFMEEANPLDATLAETKSSSSQWAGTSFWKKPPEVGGLDKSFVREMRKSFFSGAADYDCFHGIGESVPIASSVPEKRPRSYLRSNNIILDEFYFDKSTPQSSLSCLMDSVEFQSIFADLTIIQGQEKIFDEIPDHVNNELYYSGLHFISCNECSPKQFAIEYSIDPSFKTKKEEKKQRLDERIEKRSIRAMAKADRTRQHYLPRTQMDGLYVSSNQFSKEVEGEVGPDGDVLSDSSSGDEESDEESTQFAKFVSEKVGLPTSASSSTRHIDSTMAKDEVIQKLAEFSNHTRMPLTFNLIDYNIRQFLDVHLRFMVIMIQDTDNLSSVGKKHTYYLDRFFVFIVQTRQKKKRMVAVT